MIEKFVFPNAGIHITSDKVAEADFFLEILKVTKPDEEQFKFIFSAYVSALRSITFSLQYVMKKYPGFDKWYINQQEKLRNSDLAKAFVNFRNYTQKVGVTPIAYEYGMFEGTLFSTAKFYVPSDSEIKEVPSGDVIDLSEQCLKEILVVVADCYKEFDVYINPNVLFTERALDKLNWTVEDIEELVGFPRGYTNIPFEDDSLSDKQIRLKLLRPYGGDEFLQFYIDKYIDDKAS